MKQEIMKRWVDRLRSGQVKQGRNSLRRGNGARCCLGVLCDIAVEDGVVEWKYDDEDTAWEVGAGNNYAVLPEEVVEWAGMASDGCIAMPSGGASLVSLNDGGMSFAEIADRIEKDWELL